MAHRRHVYLEDVGLEDAVARYAEALASAGFRPVPAEIVPLTEGLGRVTAEPVWARISAPHYYAAAMDGVAVHAGDTVGATETSPKRLRLGEQAVWVDTGDAMPAGHDAVVMVENLQELPEGDVEIHASVAPWQHVRPMGEDVVATELILPQGHRIRPFDLGAVAAAGVTELPVRRKPVVAIIPTGTELVEPGQPIEPGRIIEFNSLILGGQIAEWGGEPRRRGISRDDYDTIKQVVSEAVQDSDLVLVNAGSSAGSEDFTADVIRELGQVIVHGVAVRPGHPVILGIVAGKPVIGVPGYPVSAALTLELFVKPLIAQMLGAAPESPPAVKAEMTRKVLSPMGEDEFVRVTLGRVGERLVVAPLNRGAGVITSLVRADGIVRIPRFSEGFNVGDVVDVQLLRRADEIERTIVCIGSHDLAIDVLANWIARTHPGRRLTAANVGSFGALLARKRGECHIGGCHLLDEDSGVYNVPYLERVLEGQPAVLVHFAMRDQGLIVPPGNPKGIHSLSDLARDDVRYVNRQKGSGTRVLLDYELKRLGIDPASIHGYEREEFTHLAVAAAVQGGAADAGLGVLSAARALNLDFVPLLQEQYDLVVGAEFWDAGVLAPLREALASSELRQEIAALGGYDVSRMGAVLATRP
ncbi:MAG TPA: molybdopterin biosynthesis protein [Chloroflexota bacterium]|nr:molybdopterin biosynthesis protein [Chloroflexota bacterium]